MKILSMTVLSLIAAAGVASAGAFDDAVDCVARGKVTCAPKIASAQTNDGRTEKVDASATRIWKPGRGWCTPISPGSTICMEELAAAPGVQVASALDDKIDELATGRRKPLAMNTQKEIECRLAGNPACARPDGAIEQLERVVRLAGIIGF